MGFATGATASFVHVKANPVEVLGPRAVAATQTVVRIGPVCVGPQHLGEPPYWASERSPDRSDPGDDTEALLASSAHEGTTLGSAPDRHGNGRWLEPIPRNRIMLGACHHEVGGVCGAIEVFRRHGHLRVSCSTRTPLAVLAPPDGYEQTQRPEGLGQRG
jgi:hypothetical protein